ncbi:MAG: glycoside hydrolase family 2 protein [Prevotella sp.]|nr:glycoside hydrolase family 2 protein [Prevotella sp.]
MSLITLPLTAQQRQYLHEGWTFGEARLPNRYPAQVPGVVQTDLLRQGLIDDPYVGMNERKVQWVDKEDWVYETSFRISDALFASPHVDLCFDGLDTYADVFLNDSKILEADNMFRRWRVSVKSLLKSGDNVLRVCFHSPVKVDMPKWEKHPHLYGASNDQSENGGLLDRKLSVFARKAGYHYGWDWGPRLVTAGIWRDVYLEAWDKVRISDVHFRQREVSTHRALVTDMVEVEASEDMANAVITITNKDNGRIVATRKCALQKGLNTIPVDITIRNPRLWWCTGLGKAEMYTFNTKVSVDDSTLACKDRRIGLRSVRLVMEPDANGHRQFYFVLNGVPVFAKGTNYIPQDNFLTNVTPERYRQTLHDAVLANMNMIRVWGGGIYENEIFYELCDEMGLMVWQDFMFACSTYPAEGEWLESVRQEATDNIRRLRNHPSIVLWCGGNECTDAWYNWGWKSRMEKDNPDGARLVGPQQEHLYYDVLKEITSKLIPDDIYTVGSPFSVRGKGSDGINGDRHFYGVGHRRMPVSAYNQEKAHFFSEYGMQSFPEYGTVLRFAPDTTTHDIGSSVMMWHQRGGVAANQTIEWYVNSEYGQPRDFRQFIYASQLLQADAMRTAIESHRRNMPYCMGSLLWQHNDCWPVASWATRDYYGHWKAAHYMVRQAFEPLLCSAIVQGDSLLVYGICDHQRKQQGKLKLTIYTLDGQMVNTLTKTVTIPANTSTLLVRKPLAELLKGKSREEVVVNMELTAASGERYQANAFLCLQKDLRLENVTPEVQVEAAEDGCYISVKADKFVRALAISMNAEDYWLDNNYFDLLPGVPVKCFMRTTLAPSEVMQGLALSCLNNMRK